MCRLADEIGCVVMATKLLDEMILEIRCASKVSIETDILSRVTRDRRVLQGMIDIEASGALPYLSMRGSDSKNFVGKKWRLTHLEVTT